MHDHHPTLSPSSFPMLAKCPCYQSGEPGEAAKSGTRQHTLLAAYLNDHKEQPEDDYGCDSTEKSQVQWAFNYIRHRTSDSRLVEERMSLIDDEFDEITFGTLDVVNMADRVNGDRLVVIDYKSGEDHGYLPQMAAYARMAMIRFAKNICEVHEVYGRGKWYKKYDVNLNDTDFVLDIIASVNNPARQPCLNEFCKWCVKQGQCHETTDAILKVATEYEPDSEIARLPLFEITTWHSSDITDPRHMAIVLDVADYLGHWSKAVKAHAKEAAIKGMVIPGYVLKDGRSNRAFADIAEAYHASGLDADSFLSCCTASVPDVEKAMAAKAGHKSEKLKAAKTSFDDAMGNVIIRKPTAQQLVKG